MRLLMTPGRRLAFDVATLVGVAALGVAAAISVYRGLPTWISVDAVMALAIIAMLAAYLRIAAHPDHMRAIQSHAILEIANESVAHLRQGLTTESAQLVCRLAQRETEAAAVAITDREVVLGFAGLGEDHHTVGGPIITRATHEAIKHDELRVLATREEIGCPKEDCSLRAAIVVPLRMRGVPVGTLKFYYTTSRLLNETQITTVEGLAHLLSTQLEVSELDRQTELATRMELKALQAQIDPHFLFNTINTIAAMIRTDPPKARDLLREFATLYRHTLASPSELITLGHELDYVRRYLVFEKARFGETSIRLEERVPEELAGIQIPAFALQPIVENAVQHGMLPGKVLEIVISGERGPGDTVVVTIADDGRGMSPEDLGNVLKPGFGSGLGIALKNVDDRLRGHFGPGSGLSVASRLGEGTKVAMSIGGGYHGVGGGQR